MTDFKHVQLSTSDRGEPQLAFDYHKISSKIAHDAGGIFNRGVEKWIFKPDVDQEKLVTAAVEIDKLLDVRQKTYKSLEKSAQPIVNQIAIDAQLEGGSHAIKSNDYKNPEHATVGEIVAEKNGYVMQHTGFGKKDGAAFCVIHDVNDLQMPDSSVLAVGSHVAIKYDELGKGTARLADRVTSLERFNQSLGKDVDGVTVNKVENGFEVKTPYSHSWRLAGVDGAEYNKAKGVHEVPATSEKALASRVAAIRTVVSNENEEKLALTESLSRAQNKKLTLSEAMTKDGSYQFGKVLATGQHFVAQESGNGYVALHRASSFPDQKLPAVGEYVKVSYEKGKATAKVATPQKTIAKEAHAR